LFPRPGIYTQAEKFLSQMGKNTATPSTKYVLKTLTNYRQNKKANQKTNKRKGKTYIRSVKKKTKRDGS
jgi:hypothetical protein